MYVSSINSNKKNYSRHDFSVNFGNNHFLKSVKLLKLDSLEGLKKLRNINVLGENGESLLHIAAGIASLKTILFLSKKINVNQKDLKGDTPISVAVEAGRLNVVKSLYSIGAKLDTQNNLGETPIMKSINNDDIFDFLLSRNVNLEFKDHFGNRLVHMIWNDKEKLLKIKEKGANLNAIDGNGQNLIHYSTEAGNIDLLNFHLKQGISPHIADFYNETPIFKTKNLKILEILKKQNVNFNQQNNFGDTLLHKALKQKNQELVNFLIEAKVNVNLLNKLRETPAFYTMDEQIISNLIQLGLDVDLLNNKGEALIHKYAKTGNTQLFSKIMDITSSNNLKNAAGETPKEIAEKLGHHSIVDLFRVGDKGFAKVIGMNDLKEELRTSVIDPLKDKAKYQHYGLDSANGILLHGLPGCGKTFIATALAEECDRNFYQIKTSDISSKYFGDGTIAIKNIFEKARKNSPSIIFIDEIEGIAPERATMNNDSCSQDNTERVNELLQQMNSLSQDNIFVIGATNNPEKVDKAIKRAGRLDRKIFVGPPDLNARIGLFKKQLEKRPFEGKIDYKKLAMKTENYIAEEIKTVIDDAARKALLEDRKIIMDDILNSIKKIKPAISKSDIEQYKKKVSVSDSNGVISKNLKEPQIKGFAKVAGMKDLKETLIKDVIKPLLEPEKAFKYGLDPINGMLLYGPPGTGKTFIATAFAEESGRDVTIIKPSDILSPYHGQTTLNLRKLFEQAEYNSPSIVFIDEIDAIAPQRKGTNSGEASTIVTELLQQLNNCAQKDIFVIAATNAPQNIDDAVRRVGRFDKTIFVPPLDKDAREEFFIKNLSHIYKEPDIDYKKLAQKTEYFTAVELKQLVIKESAKQAYELNVRISEKMLLDAIDKVKPNLNETIIEEYKNKIKF